MHGDGEDVDMQREPTLANYLPPGSVGASSSKTQKQANLMTLMQKFDKGAIASPRLEGQ